MSRINVKMKSDNEAKLMRIRPQITEVMWKSCLRSWRSWKTEIFSCCPAVSKSIDDRIYETIMATPRRKRDKNRRRDERSASQCSEIPSVSDKPNNHELGEMFGGIKSDEDIITYAGKLQEMGPSAYSCPCWQATGRFLSRRRKRFIRWVLQEGGKGGRSRRFDGGRSYRISRQTGYAYVKLGTASGSATAFSEE